MNDLPPLQPQEVPWPSIEDVDPSAFVVPSSTVLFAAPGPVPAAAIQQPVAPAAATAAAVPATAGPSGGAPITATATAKASGAPPAAATRKWASAEDWERHRAIISELYQHRRLKDVVDHMERVYDFYATERMYKFRIKTWGLKKNYRADAVQKAIQRLEQGRIQEADGDLAAGAAQDLPKLDLPRLQRYLRRNPAALQRLRQSQGAGTAEITIPELQALLASAAARSAYAYAASSYGAGAGGNSRSGRSGSSKSPSPPFPPVMAPAGAAAAAAASAAFHRPLLPNKMRASPQLEAPDEILHLLRTYINGSYRDGRTPEQLAGELTAVGDRDEVMLDFVLKFRAAHAMIAEQQLRVGFYCLRVCFERIEKVLRDGEACARRVLLLYLLNAALDVSVDFAMPEVVQILFRHVRSLAESLLGPNHPAAAIARRFSQLDPSEHVSVLKLTRRLIREDLEGFETETETSGGGGGGGNGIPGATTGKQPGVAAPADLGRKAISEPALTLYNSTLEQSRGSVEDIAEGLERMRLKTHEVVRDNWLIRLWIAMRVSVAMYEQGRGDEVEDLMLGGFPTCPPRRQPDRVNLMARCFWLRGEKRTEEGRLVEGEQHFRLYIELAETTWGPLDDTVVTTMPLLRDNLLLQGKTDEAEKVQKEWHRRLNERQKERERSK